MAKVDIKMPDDFLNKLQNLGSDEDGIAERVLEAGAEVVEIQSCLGHRQRYENGVPLHRTVAIGTRRLRCSSGS